MLGVVLLGRSNSGKSTIGKSVADRVGARYVSSGDIARSMSSDIQKILNQGELAPENIMRDRILSEINNMDRDFILDGFPRFEDQYKWMKKMINGVNFIYIVIDAPYNEILYRAMKRNRCDDASISKKMQMYEDYTEPMVKEIIRNETVYYINNGEDDNIYDNIEILCKIMEKHHVNNSEI